MITVNLQEEFAVEELVNKIVYVLRNGGVVLMPSDTCYGFVGDAKNDDVMNKICELKSMPKDKPISVFVGDVYDVFDILDLDEYGRELVLQFMPGMLTVVAQSNTGDWLGVRVPDHELMRMVAKKFGGPLFTTSANKHGGENPYGIESVEEQLGSKYNEIDMIIDGGVLDANRPSTVVKILDNEIEILREGDLADIIKAHYLG